jgi:hypothetical protein
VKIFSLINLPSKEDPSRSLDSPAVTDDPQFLVPAGLLSEYEYNF